MAGYNYYNVTQKNNVITLSVCYTLTPYTGVSTLENNFEIPIENLNSYTLIVNVYDVNQTTFECDYQNVLDSVNLTFLTPVTETISLSAYDLESANHVSVYPNPTSDLLNFSTVGEPINKIIVYDSLGKRVKLFNSIDRTYINLEDLSNGVYFVEFQDNKNIFSRKKIIKE